MPAFAVPDNLAFDSYGDLVTAIKDWMNRNDLSGSVQAMIALAESRMRRKLDPVFTETTTTLTTVDGVIALPTDCGSVNRVVYNYYNIPRWSGYDTAAIADENFSTDPFAYTVEANALRIWPPVSVALTVYYQPVLASLSESAPTNPILSKFPDLYFFGAMMFAEGYVANDERSASFKALFDEALMEVSEYLAKQRYTGRLVPKIQREF